MKLGWKDVTIKQYTQIQELKDLAPLDYEIAKLAILTGKSTSQIEQLTVPQMKEAIHKTAFLNTEPQKKPVPGTLRVKGKRFRVTVFYKDMNAAQLIDSLSFAKKGNNVADLMAVFLTPLKYNLFAEKYDGKTHEARSKFLYENMTMGQVHPISLFFSQVFDNLPEVILPYLENQLKNLNLTKEEADTVLQTVGAGSQPWTT